MSQLALHLLGPPRIELDGEPVKIQRRKAVALMVYLAITGERHSREKLATLFWPQHDESCTRNNLRVALAALKRDLGCDRWFKIDGDTISLDRNSDFWLDVDHFYALLATCVNHAHSADETCLDCRHSLTEAVELYRDDFLAGFTLSDSPEFDDWQFFQTEGLRLALAGALERLVQGYGDQGNYETSIPFARRWLALDPLHEPAHCHLMKLYAWSGQHAVAQRQYQECKRILDEELGVDPEQETTTLYKQIKTRKFLAQKRRNQQAKTASSDASLYSPTPPKIATPFRPLFFEENAGLTGMEHGVFVARERELGQLNTLLDSTLSGQGRAIFVTGEVGNEDQLYQ